MPHIIVEYSLNCIDESEVGHMLMAIHDAIADSGLFKAEQIRTRAYPFQDYTHAGGSDAYIHIQARIKAGRDEDNKKRLSKAILSAYQRIETRASVITCEVIDMERSSYDKYEP